MVPKTPSCPIQKASLYTLVRSNLSRVAESAANAARREASCAACSADFSKCALCARQKLAVDQLESRQAKTMHVLGFLLF